MAEKASSVLMLQTLTAAMAKKSAYELILQYGKAEKEDKYYQTIYKMIGQYYARDGTAQSVDPEVLKGMLVEEIRNPKAAAVLTELLDSAISTQSDTSVANIESLIIQTRLGLVKDKLAVALANRDSKVEDSLLEELNSLKNINALEELDGTGMEEYPIDSVESLLAKAYDIKNLIRIWPQSLAKRIGGGLQPGNHIVIYATPNKGKSAMVVTIASSIARGGRRVLIIGNEEPAAQYWMRFIQAIAGKPREEVLQDLHGIKQIAMGKGLGNITIVTAAPGNKTQIESLIEKYKPDCLVIDQLRNIDTGKSESRTNQLEAAANFARNMAVKHHIVVFSVTQAGDSARNKAILDMGDIDYSNTGIPASADLMIAIGATEEQEAQGIRIITLTKNKLTAQHENWPVRLNIPLSRYQDI
jgi:archaellum biogenesis ATPase FlaH